jgi:hypothetical protein
MGLNTMALAGTVLATMTIGLATPAFAATHAVRQAASQAVPPPVPQPVQEAAPPPAPSPEPAPPPQRSDRDQNDRFGGICIDLEQALSQPKNVCTENVTGADLDSPLGSLLADESLLGDGD